MCWIGAWVATTGCARVVGVTVQLRKRSCCSCLLPVTCRSELQLCSRLRMKLPSSTTSFTVPISFVEAHKDPANKQ